MFPICGMRLADASNEKQQQQQPLISAGLGGWHLFHFFALRFLLPHAEFVCLGVKMWYTKISTKKMFDGSRKRSEAYIEFPIRKSANQLEKE